jgi:hypothetical protein
MEQKHHSILERPWEYSIHEVRWGEADASGGTFLDVVFAKGETTRRFRFVGSQQTRLELSGGYPQDCGEIVILDIRDRGWEGLTVEVAEGGATGSPLTLYAREVVEIDLMQGAG